MQEFWSEYMELVSGTFAVLMFAYLSLLLSWPAFLLLEKFKPVKKYTPGFNYTLNWKITCSNLLLAPPFAAMIVLLGVSLVNFSGLPQLRLSTSELSVGIPFFDIILQGAAIFLTAVFLGDLWYYWWHRAQHKVPFLWELHKLHHSDETMNSTTIYRSHFLEPAGQALVKGLTIGLIFDVTEAPPTALAIVAGALLPAIWDYFIHANVRMDSLNRVMPFFSVPQYHWIHHSKMPQHQDKNFAIWLPMFDVAFGSYYRPRVDEYPASGLSSGEKIESVWEAQTGPFSAWFDMLKNRYARRAGEHPS